MDASPLLYIPLSGTQYKFYLKLHIIQLFNKSEVQIYICRWQHQQDAISILLSMVGEVGCVGDVGETGRLLVENGSIILKWIL
jgi:hypothetical protein